MRRATFVSLVVALVTGAPGAASAQDAPPPATELLVSAVALASVHPIDDTYVGLPYLDRGLGGVGPGAALSLTLRHRMFAAGVEWSAAHVAVEQRGRLADEASTGRLRDSLLSLFAGVEVPAQRFRFRLVAGLSRVRGEPASDGVPIDRSYQGLPISDGTARYAPMAGFDLTRSWKERIDLLGTFRYSQIERGGGARQRGVSPHVLRAGVGLSFRIAG